MITTNTIFDKRQLRADGKGRIYISLCRNQQKSLISVQIEVLPSQWDGQKVVNHPQMKFLNNIIFARKNEIDNAILRLTANGTLANKSLKEAAELIKMESNPEYREKIRKATAQKNNFGIVFKRFIDLKTKPGTINIYKGTLKKIDDYCKSIKKDINKLTFPQMTVSWLRSFENYCLTTEKQNTANIHLRNIRAAFNFALDEGICKEYPFRRYPIRPQLTIDKSYTSEEIRAFMAAKCNNKGEEESRDMFILMFCLIGINYGDLFHAGKPQKGRLLYIREKTGKPYSIKLQPEAIAIIKKYAGKDHLLNISERFANYKTYFNRMSKSMRKIGKTTVPGKKSTGNAILKKLNYGAARTSWATIAQSELDIPRDTIAAALGHNTIDVTTTYLRTNWQKKIDEANRKVLDLIFGKND